jgi:TolB-like protein/DNA-binding winged helix-turn-helix (wHTH) protein/Tfp pilus assembly protein PilF
MELAHEAPLRLGEMRVRPATREVEFPGGRVVLEPRVMEVLVALARANGEVVSRDDLIAACWGGRIVSEDAINRVISRIRRLAAATGGRDFALETITKVGYRLRAAPVPAARTVDAVAGTVSSKPPFRARWIAAGAAALVMLLVGAGLVSFRLMTAQDRASPTAALTLAVLPFDELSDDAETRFLAGGLSRELRNTLSRVRGLRVIADSSSFAVAAEGIDAVEIGRRLGADLLLDGSVRQGEGAIRVTVELVDAKTGTQAWAQSGDFVSDDLGRAQAFLFASVLERLVHLLGPDRIESFAPPRRADPESFSLVLEARQRTVEAAMLRQQGRFDELALKLQEAEEIARLAVAADPNNADALVQLARAVGSWAAPYPAIGRVAKDQRESEAVDLYVRALAADPDNPGALTALAERYRRVEWRWRESETLFRRALAIDPNDPDTHTSYAYLLSHMGRCVEGVEHARLAARLDPAFPWRRLAEPRLLKCAGRPQEADRLYRRNLELDREDVSLASEIYFNHMSTRDAAAARALAAYIRDELWAGEPVAAPMAALIERIEAGADALDGRPDALLALLEDDTLALARPRTAPRLTERGRGSTDTLWTLAIEFAAAGASSRAVDLLEQAMAAGSLYIPETLAYGAFEFTPEVREDPRYVALWWSDPRLVELMEIRRESLRARQMDGVLPSGRRIRARAR